MHPKLTFIAMNTTTSKIQQEFDIIAPASSSGKKLSLLKFHRNDKFAWKDVKIRCDLDGKQPLLMKVGSGRAARRFKAVREGGVSENAKYYVFFKTVDKNRREVFEVQPVTEWYNCSATQRYKVLNAVEAEKMFEKRHKILNQFSVMPQRGGEDNDEADNNRGSFKVSEMDDWDDSDAYDRDSDDDNEDNKSKLKAKLKKKKDKNKNKEEEDNGSEAGEESDEGDFDDREVDYMSDTSSSEESEADEKDDKTDVKAISEETGLRDLLCSDDEDEERGDQGNDSTSDDHRSPGMNEDRGPQIKASESDLSGLDSDSDDIDELEAPVKPSLKRKYPSDDDTLASSSAPSPPVRRPHIASEGSGGPDSILEDMIKKYLMRKPITLKQLIKGVKGKLKAAGQEFDLAKTGAIIRKLKPEQTKGQSEHYLYLKPDRPT